MIRILRGNNRREYFLMLGKVLSDGANTICKMTNHDCSKCPFPDVCADLLSADDYCAKVVKKFPV